MGCNQATTNNPAIGFQPLQIPCQPDDIALYLNKFRQDPAACADVLEKEIDKFTDQYSIIIDEGVLYRTNEGREVWREAIDYLRKVEPLPPLIKHEGLCKAAAMHADDLARGKDLSHTGSDGSEPLDRVCKFCRKSNGKTGENIGIDFKLKNRNFAQNTIYSLVIDDGVEDRGHRLSVFDTEFLYFGSATRTQGDKVITVINYLSKDWPTL